MLVGSLYFCDLIHMLETDCADYVVTGTASALLNSGSLFKEVGDGRSFCDEREGSVGLYGNEGGGRDTRLKVGRSCVELFAEVHRLYTTSTKSRTHRRRWGSLSRSDENALTANIGIRERPAGSMGRDAPRPAPLRSPHPSTSSLLLTSTSAR